MPTEYRPFQFSNFARSTAAFPISIGDTTITIQQQDKANFPSPTPGQICSVILSSGTKYEVVYCTSRTENEITVERAQEGTAAQSFPTGAKVVHSATAGFFTAKLAPPPSTPVLTLTAGTVTAELEWTASVPFDVLNPIVAYEIYRSVNAGPFVLRESVDDLVLNWFEVLYPDVDAATSYAYYVVAIQQAGVDSLPSNTETMAVAIRTVVLASTEQVDITDPANKGMVGYSDTNLSSWVIPYSPTSEDNTNLGDDWRCIARNPNSGLIIAAGNGHLMYSDDNAETWTWSGETTAPGPVNPPQFALSIAAGSRNDIPSSILYVSELDKWFAAIQASGGARGGLMWSSNGTSWTEVTAFGYNFLGAFQAQGGVTPVELLWVPSLARLFMTVVDDGSEAYIFWSDDGVTWDTTNDWSLIQVDTGFTGYGRRGHGLAWSETIGKMLYVGGGGGASLPPYYNTSVDGVTWGTAARIQPIQDDAEVWAIIEHPPTGDLVVIADQNNQAETYVVKWNGATFTGGDISPALSTSRTGMRDVIWHSGLGKFFGVTRQLFGSTQPDLWMESTNGLNWTNVPDAVGLTAYSGVVVCYKLTVV